MTQLVWEGQLSVPSSTDWHLVDEDRNEWLVGQCRLFEESGASESD
jgi:hypothetical protein